MKLLTKSDLKKLQKQDPHHESGPGCELPSDKLKVVTKFFTPWGNWTWFAVSASEDPETGEFIMRFPTPEDRVEWVEESYQNLYEPTWEFRMVSCRDAILGEDIDVIEENETGANFLYRGIANSYWRDGYYGSVNTGVRGNMFNMRAPWRPEPPFDVTDRELEEVINH